MLIDKLVLYEQGHITEINQPTDSFYYLFDYDERSFNINMEFQHFHSFFEIHILLAEYADHIIEGELYDLRLFDIVALKPSLLHKSQYPEGPPCKRIIIDFLFPMNITGLSENYKQLFQIFYAPVPIYRFEGIHRKKIFGILNEIFCLTKQKTPLYELRIHQKFNEFLSYIYLIREQNTYQVHTSKDNLTEKIYHITSYIHEHYMDELSLDFIAHKFYISSYYLSHQFKKVTGFTLINYIQMTRIRNAQTMLLFTEKRISDIAIDCGFNSFSQFNRVFNKYNSISPSAYRKNTNVQDFSLLTYNE